MDHLQSTANNANRVHQINMCVESKVQPNIHVYRIYSFIIDSRKRFIIIIDILFTFHIDCTDTQNV